MSREALFLFALAPIRLEPVNLHTVFVFMELPTILVNTHCIRFYRIFWPISMGWPFVRISHLLTFLEYLTTQMSEKRCDEE